MINTNSTLARVTNGRKKRSKRWKYVASLLCLLAVAAFSITLSLGQSFTPPQDVINVLLGENVPGASFVVGQLRLPRAIISLLVGMSFGMAGVAFQVMLRNPLASPDIIGVSSGATAAAVFAIIMLHMDGTSVAFFSIAVGLLVALAVYGLSYRNGASGARLILVGIGVSAMIESFIVYLLSQAQAWDRQEAMRWLSGSVNSAQIHQALPLIISLLIFGGFLLSRSRDLEALRMGDDTAHALGVRVGMTRLTVIVSAVGLIAVGVAITGPIAFVAFLSGPIAARLVKNNGSLLIPSGLVGACLVMGGDYIGQFLLQSRYPVGVITGALGAPYLIYLIIRVNRKGGSL
ncbi:MAG: iron ABC transporter permease [Gammaproteobacteria bacterium]|uniref:FecCD family ABC transporter permease n=1 Tax=unclassified Marinomonas TaxID=196814 RepID=UPI000C1F00F3|nr:MULTISPECIES: iron ABC transporter permease [unclassified Marinomonas]MBU1294443.1 iron ABC transporter permease [Gammaproteobacteria bacterium]MBU1466177.1 iron ABC transporter permease [Gammaproteobacteria bacterium]MBU2023803.1 iron ABC transporter permease [Gammaproteobacteria bacterium]MBU2238914.1 iron ABC transporter permease [Gammaproteobacteria bacterium]MBU2320198.1 iron ABC transporter permease [Gammaproteobacteria bacterium]